MELDKRIQSALKPIKRQLSGQQLALLPATQVNDAVKAIYVYRHDKPVLRAKSQIDQKHASADKPSRLTTNTLEEPPELSSCLFSLPKRRPGTHFQPEVTQKTTRAPNYQFPMPKTLPWVTFPDRDRPEHHQSYQTVNFPRPNDALGAISSPRSPRRPLDLANNSFSIPKRCPGKHFQPQVTQKPTRAPKPSIFHTRTMPWEPFPGQGHPEDHQSFQTALFVVEL